MSYLTDYYFPTLSNNSNTSLSSRFEANKNYLENSVPFITSSYLEEIGFLDKKIPFFDMHRENVFYGIIDLDGDIVAPLSFNANQEIYKEVPSKNNKSQYMLDFVADAFNDMLFYLRRQVLKGTFPQSSTYYNIGAYRSFGNIDNLYVSNLKITATKFRGFIIQNKILDSKIVDFSTFIKPYLKFLIDNLVVNPATISKTAQYFNYTNFISGLAVNTSEDNFNDDGLKYTKYFLDPGFPCFSDACVRFGFRFDKNIPSIICADLKSPAMIPYFQKYGIENIEDMFKKRFRKMYFEDLTSLKFFFLNSYNTFLIDNKYYLGSINDVCSVDARKNVYKERLEAKPSDIEKIGDAFWLKIYIYIKNYETGINFTQEQFEALFKKANELLKLKREKQALTLINNKFSEVRSSFYLNSLLPPEDMVQQSEPPPMKFKNTITL